MTFHAHLDVVVGISGDMALISGLAETQEVIDYCAARRDRREGQGLTNISGEYYKKLREARAIESEMTERILKSSISILEALNHVRNNQSLAHDNPVLNYGESLLIFNHVASSIQFLRDLEKRQSDRRPANAAGDPLDDDVPF